MDKILKELKKHKVYVEDLFILRNGETSNTYLAKQNDKKIVLKIFKKNYQKILNILIQLC